MTERRTLISIAYTFEPSFNRLVLSLLCQASNFSFKNHFAFMLLSNLEAKTSGSNLVGQTLVCNWTPR